jgi:hypothetical protein
VQPYYPGVERGLARSLFALVRGVSYYIRVRGTLEIGTRYPGIWVDPEHGATHITTYPEPPEDTWVLPPWRQSYALEEVLPGHVGEVDSIG